MTAPGTTDNFDEPGTRIDPVLARSWLLVNAALPQRFAHAVDSRADIVILDIEDSVAPKDKAAARANVLEWLAAGHDVWVRVNGHGTEWWDDDVAALASAGPAGVMLAMTESAEQVEETARRLPGLKIVALVETAVGVENLSEIARATGTFRLAFGIGDFRRDTGLGDRPDTLAYTRSRFTIASTAAKLPPAIDGPTVGATGRRLAEATTVTEEFGMRGKLCLMPEQCATVNEGLSPSQEELAWATGFLADFERNGSVIKNGSDLPRLARAQKIVDLADSYGITPSEEFSNSFGGETPNDGHY